MDTFTVVCRALVALLSVLALGTGSIALGVGLMPLPAFIVLLSALVAIVYAATEGME